MVAPAMQARARIPEPIDGVLFGLLAAVLLLANLGNHSLWQDEAQTALIAQTVQDRGIPMGTDGRNHFGQEQGVEYGEDGIWRWHTWLSFYLVAASFAALGSGTFAARLPFALAGIAAVALTWWVSRALFRDRLAAGAAAGLLAVSVPFLLLQRQCRWYGLTAPLVLAGILAYTRIAGSRRAALALLAAATLLFHAHFLYAAMLLTSLLAHAALFERARLRATALVSAGVALLGLPWVVFFSATRVTPDYAARLADLGDTAWAVGRYAGLLVEHGLAGGAFAAIPLLLMLHRRLQGQPVLAVRRDTWSGLALIGIACAVHVLALALLGPGVAFRYLAPLLSLAAIAVGLWLADLLRAAPLLGVAALAVWLATSRLPDFAYELTHDYDDPVEGIVGHLRQHAAPDDVVAIVYEDLPVKFYTGMRVIGGLTGEDLAQAEGADWIVLRRHDVAPQIEAIRETLKRYLDLAPYRCVEIPYPDIPFANREDPKLHRFRTAEGVPGVIVCQRVG
jgi:4-amino-4-deoxy-L-arabinose transferase-like glycosyltransferase